MNQEDRLEKLTDPKKITQSAIKVIAILFGGFFLWAILVPLDEGVPTPGEIVVDTKRKPVEHPTGGVVQAVYVKEGDAVKVDQLLIKLSDEIARVNYQTEKSRVDKLNILKKQLEATKPLVKEGLLSELSQYDLEKEIADFESAPQRFDAAKKDLARTEIRSPTSGSVVGIQVQSVGAVVKSGEKIMDIVPEKEQLIIESKIPPQYIDRIHSGDSVVIRFSNFANAPQLAVDGQIITLSSDALVDQKVGASYYLARILVTEKGMAELGSRSLQPGMAVEALIKTGSRTLLQYLLHPLTKRMAASLVEE